MIKRPTARMVHLSGLVLLASLALFHISITPFMFNELSGRLVWYLSTDFSVLLLLFLNVAVLYIEGPTRVPWRFCHIANAIGVALGILQMVSVNDPINVIVLIAYILVAVGAYLRDRFQKIRTA
ncbi:MAG: hypothetical protein EXR11_09450 [Rhodospirillaceae bacterium]|nr:hypothetical protein [Rhodospirillaceae bacterium]